MAWVNPSTRATSDFITAAIWNQDAVDNAIALHTGAAALTNQQEGNFLLASSATQLTARRDELVFRFMEIYA